MSSESHIPAVPGVRPVTGRGWNNPIFRRYCRARLRPKGLLISLLIVVMGSGFIFEIARETMRHRTHVDAVDAERAGLIPLLIIQGVILFVFGTAQAAGGMVAERDEGVIDYQRLIPMRPLSKVLGYLFGLPVREYVLVAATLPFTAWAIWKGQVAFRDWGPVYLVFFSATLLYHLTGLVTGTVVKNRRWAFLVSIGLVFCLYTVMPQLAKFGLVFFDYLTIMPVYYERLPGMLPKTAGAVVEAGQRLIPTVKFFNLNFSEAVFTLFSQCGLVLTFLAMLCRKWRKPEAHLLGKVWAVVFFIWIQVLLLGNALPLVEPGDLFPSRGLWKAMGIARIFGRGMYRDGEASPTWAPEPSEAVLLAGVYGTVTLVLLFVLAGIITPTPEQQMRGWRRSRKKGLRSLPFFSDAGSATWFTAVMALAGAGGWFLFTRGLVESRWYPGQEVPLSVLGYFTAIMLAVGLGYQALMEWRGGRAVGLVTILGGAAPVMVGAVTGVISNDLMPVATWIVGLSPVSQPLYAVESLLSLAVVPEKIELAVPRAFQFWLLINGLAALWLLVQLRASRKAMANKILETGAMPASGPVVAAEGLEQPQE
jgi:hypothetical protein